MMEFRYSFALNKTKTARRFGLPVRELPEPRYNIAPGQEIVAITNLLPEKISLLTFGLTQDHLQNPEKTACLDLKTVQRRIFYRELLATKRCIIPADGFYLWKKVAKKSFVPYRITLKWNLPFSFAGLWHEWIDEASGDIHRSCGLLTVPSNELLSQTTTQMPAILSLEAEGHWLSGDLAPESLLKLLTPFPAEKMKMFPVSSRINDKHFNSPELAEPVPEATDQLGNYVLFS